MHVFLVESSVALWLWYIIFFRANIMKMKDSGKVNAFLVIYDKNDTSAIPSSGFSADKSCPNDAYGEWLHYSHAEISYLCDIYIYCRNCRK